MKVKVTRVSPKSFVLVFSAINAVAGFLLGAFVTVISLIAPDEQSQGMGVWSILVFPILNALVGAATGFFLTAMYNLLAPLLGSIEVEAEEIK